MKFISDDLLDKLVVDLKEGYFYDTCITKSVIVANSNGINIEVKITEDEENTIKRYADLIGYDCITLEK